ncbi:hypothetical protein NDU88_001468, partial [Pleurodeles waltl]
SAGLAACSTSSGRLAARELMSWVKSAFCFRVCDSIPRKDLPGKSEISTTFQRQPHRTPTIWSTPKATEE